MNAVTATVAASVAVGLAVCAVGAIALGSLSAAEASCTPTAGTSTAATSTGTAPRWDGEQRANATTIVTVGARMRVPRYGWVIAVATAMQESSLRNLSHLGAANDHDSLGLFQQRPSQGWGTPAQVLDPTYSATAFYVTLLRVPGWQNLPLTQAAQKVQVSAYPQAYATWELDARALVDAIATRLGLGGTCGGGWVLPLPAGSFRLTSGYGPRWGHMHYGQDFAAPTGTAVYAASAGTVVAAECTSPFCDRPGVVDASGMPLTPGCGWTIHIRHSVDVATAYCHLSAISVRVGDTLTAGQLIGWVGSTGNSTGPHLHFQVHVGAGPIDSSTTVDSLRFLAMHGVAVR